MQQLLLISTGKKIVTTANWIQLDRNFRLENASDCVTDLQTPAKWEALRKLPVVALLAEAGTGKTTELKIQQQFLIDRGEYVFHGDVQLIASTGELAFGVSIEQWRQSEASAYFFLDAADVAQIDSVNSLPNALSKTLSIIGKNSAHIIIACRPSEWSSPLSERLFELCNPPVKDAIYPLQKIIRSLGLRAIPSYSLESLSIVQREEFLLWLTKDKAVALDLLRRLSETNTLWMASRPRDLIWLASYWNKNRKIGTISELMESAVADRIQETRERRPALHSAGVRGAAQRIALIGILCSMWRFSVDDSSVGCVDITKVLPDLANREHSDLLARGLFDLAYHGSVQFFHRSAQEYMAAREVLDLLEQGVMSHPRIRSLFTKDVDGRRVVPAHLREVAAWVAGRDRRVFQSIVSADPVCLLDGGDPAQLSCEQKIEVLKGYAEEVSKRKRDYRHLDSHGLARFCSPDLAGWVKEVLSDSTVSEALLTLALRIIPLSSVEGCFDLLLGRFERCSASARNCILRALHQGPYTHPYELRAIYDRGIQEIEAWTNDNVGLFLRCIFPKFSTAAEVYAILKRAPRQPWNQSSVLTLYANEELAHQCTTEDRRFFLQHLTDDLLTREGAARLDWLYPLFLDLLKSEYESGNRITALVQSASGVAYKLVRHSRWIYNLDKELEWAGSVLLKDPELRRHATLNCFVRARRISGKRGKKPRNDRFWNVAYDAIGVLEETDLGWMSDCLLSDKDFDLRVAILETLLRFRCGDSALQQSLLSAASAKHRWIRRACALHRKKNTSTRTMDETLEKHRKEAEEAKERQLAIHLDQSRQIQSRLSGILDGSDTGALDFLYSKGRTGSTSLGSCNLSKIAELYGNDIADALESGLRHFWRLSSLEAILRGIPERKISSERCLALAGLALEFETSGDFSHFSPDECAKIARIGLFELNGCPAWYEAFADSTPTSVEAALRDFTHHAGFGSILSAAAQAGPVTSRIASNVALDVLSNAEHVDKSVLKEAAEVLLLGADRGKGNTKMHKLVDAIMCRLSEMIDDESAFWWAFVFAVSPLAPIEGLESLRPLPSGEMEDSHQGFDPLRKVLSILDKWRQHQHIAVTPLGSASTEDVGSSARIQCRLLRAAYENLPPTSDVLSEHAEVYNDDDYARSMRNYLLGELLAHPRREVRSALLNMVEHEVFVESKDWILSEVDRMRRQDAVGAPFSIDDACAWVRRRVMPRTSVDLFRFVQEVLGDIADHVENDDFSMKEILRNHKLVKEHELQLWLAGEIESRGRRIFTVARETVISDLDRRDILIEKPDINARVVIEIKVAERWTGTQLQARLRDQLVEQYMRPRNCKFGIYLLFLQGPEAGKQTWEIEGVARDFSQVVESLKRDARGILDGPSALGVEELEVVGIDLRRVQ